MSRKNHQMVNGRLLQTDKSFSQLKQQQKGKINQWLYEAYAAIFDRVGLPPDNRHNDAIVSEVYSKIEEAEIWIPYDEVVKYFLGRKNAFRKRYIKAHPPEPAGETK